MLICVKKESSSGKVCSPGTFAKFVDHAIDTGLNTPSKKCDK